MTARAPGKRLISTTKEQWKEIEMKQVLNKIDKMKSTAVVGLSVFLIATMGIGAAAIAEGSSPGGWNGRAQTDQVLTSIAASPNGGYWTQVDRIDPVFEGPSKTAAHHGAPDLGTSDTRGSIASRPQGGYWIVGFNGEIVAKGGAPEICGGDLSTCSGFRKNLETTQIVAAAATQSGNGFYALGRDGAVWTAGDAIAHGDAIGDGAVPTGIATTVEGGYYIVMDDGGVYAANAPFYGSTGGSGGHGNFTGIAVSRDAQGHTDGYWVVGNDGGILTFGSAPFLGSSGGDNGGSRVLGITATHDGQHYAWVHHSGRVQVSS